MTIQGDYPIALAHGICRFDQLLRVTFGVDNQPDDGLHYFRRIRSTLIEAGFDAFHTNVSWAGSVNTRADQLKAGLEQRTNNFTDHAKVHIIAHSMGGLDARRMIYKHRMQDRVASLSTIGTPHHGSSFADWGIERHGWVLAFSKFLGIDANGIADLTSARCGAFNEEAGAFERGNGVKYQTFAGVQTRERTFWPLRLRSHGIIEEREGANDGLVSLTSAKWRDDVFVKQIEADHLNEVGWADPSEPNFLTDRHEFEQTIRAFYVDIAQGL